MKHFILSAPVYDKTTQSYTGFLSVKDLIEFIVSVHDDHVKGNTELRNIIKNGMGEWVKKQEGRLGDTQQITAKHLSRRNPFFAVSPSDSLMTAIQHLTKGNFHRVPVVNNGKVVKVISQSVIFKFIASHFGRSILEGKDMTVDQLHLGSVPVITVKKDETVIDTFRLLVKHKISGIALVDSYGKITESTSAKDLGLFLANPNLSTFNQPIHSYLNEIRKRLVDIQTPCLTIFGHDSFSRAIGLMAATKVHRIFVVDNEHDFKPKRVISVTDILKFFLNSP
eukprot:TRINITY_DN1108_c0_g1_i2.p1 TRINITY_DN1108_c0_g1~~TRINITY_DN1108_c0_g1_i2.p1  ORF type:complete len:281 (+),score=40.29 TRINITY_DN1108_c0_g1_i2:817-1659(+)